MQTKSLLLLFCLLVSKNLLAQAEPTDLKLAWLYFREAHTICEVDNGKLWHVSLKGQKSFEIVLPENMQQAAESRLAAYDGAALRATEVERGNRRQQILADYRSRLVNGPVLILPLGQTQVCSILISCNRWTHWERFMAHWS